jgi:SAM-dependent methyltransferase
MKARMPPDPARKGPMDETYALGRITNEAISYRYRARALTAAQTIDTRLNPQGPLKVLDLGSADGKTLVEMARWLPPGTVFTGIEYSPVLVSMAGGLGPNIRVMRGDMAALPAAIKDRRYDVVTVLAALEHVREPVVALKNAAGLLESEGIIVATCPEPHWDKLATRLGLLEDHHETHISASRMATWMRQAGLAILEYRRFMWAPVGFLPYLGIRVSPSLSLKLDALISRPRFLNWLFINQLWVARRG